MRDLKPFKYDLFCSNRTKKHSCLGNFTNYISETDKIGEPDNILWSKYVHKLLGA